MKAVGIIASAAFIIALPLLLVTTSVRVAASEVRLYEYSLREYDAGETTGVELAELDRASREIIHYFENDAEELRIVVDRGGEEVSLFNERETLHMVDVKDLFTIVYRVNEIALAVVLGTIGARYLWAREVSIRRLAKESLAGVGLGIAAVGGLAAFAAVGFSEFWTRFHEIAFPNDLWQLNPATDRLIQMFPVPFWEDATFLVAGATLAQAFAVVVLASGYLFFTRRARDSQEAVSSEPVPVSVSPGHTHPPEGEIPPPPDEAR